MKRSIIFISAISMILAAFVSSHAQMEFGDRVRDKLDRNDELLRTARDLVIETNSVKGRTLLKSARALQQEAKKVYMMAVDKYMRGNMHFAGRLMTKARDMCDSVRNITLRAIAVSKREAMIEANAKKSLERARNRYEQAKALLGEQGGRDLSPARNLIEESRVQLERSRDNMREHMYEVSLRLSNLSESLSMKALSMLKRETRVQDDLSREIHKTDRVLERIEEQYGYQKHSGSEKIYKEARDLQQKALQSMSEDKKRIALNLTLKARRLALKSLKLLSSAANRENVERALRFTDGLLEKAGEMARSSNSRELSKQVRNSQALQDKAKTEFHRERFESAFKLTQRARGILKEALAVLESPLNEVRVKEAMETTENLIKRIKGNKDIMDNAIARDLMDKALKHQRKARENFRRSRLRAALTHTKLARSLANKALEQLKDGKI